MKNKRFTIFRLFARLVAKANFWGFWALKGPIFIILTPILFSMLYNVILHLNMKLGALSAKIRILRPKNLIFRVFGDLRIMNFCKFRFTKYLKAFFYFFMNFDTVFCNN